MCELHPPDSDWDTAAGDLPDSRSRSPVPLRSLLIAAAGATAWRFAKTDCVDPLARRRVRSFRRTRMRSRPPVAVRHLWATALDAVELLGVARRKVCED